MGAILKSHRYRLVDNNDFELPLPMKFQVYKKDCPIAEYEISETEELTCRILTKYKEDMLTTVYRPIKLSDIYYLLSCRVFQNNTPFTATELSLLGLEKYNVYDILKKTRGITPFDNYWIKFEGDDCDYDKALEDFNSVTAPKEENSSTSEEIAGVSEISGQHKSDTAKISAENISDADIDNILRNGGGKMSQGVIEKLLTEAADEPESIPAPEPVASSGGTMPQDDIEKLLAGSAAEPEPAPATEPAAPSGGKMSQDDIEKLLAGATAEPEPAPEPPAPSGGKMSQDDIEKLLAGAAAEPEPAPAPEPPAPSGGKMSQDDIEKLLAGAATEPAPTLESASPSGGKMSQDDIEKLLAGAAAEPEPAPAPEPAAPSSGKMSEDDIAALLQSMQDEANK